MVFYNATTKQGICQEIDRLCNTTDTSYSRLDKTARINQALERVYAWIMTADGMWQFDDENYSTDPVGTGTLVSGQHLYSFSDAILDILELNILDLNGVYRRLTPFDASEHGMSFEEYFNIQSGVAQSGMPQYYDKVGETIVLDKAPTATYVTLASGLQVKFKRTASLFTAASDTSTDSTVPGFASPYHVILAYMASIPYCATYTRSVLPSLIAFVGDTYPKPTGMKKQILDFYTHREKDSKKQMTTLPVQRFR